MERRKLHTRQFEGRHNAILALRLTRHWEAKLGFFICGKVFVRRNKRTQAYRRGSDRLHEVGSNTWVFAKFCNIDTLIINAFMLHLCHNYCDRRSKRFVVSCSVNPRIAKGWQSCDLLVFYGDIFAVWRTGFQPFVYSSGNPFCTWWGKMSEIVQHGAT